MIAQIILALIPGAIDLIKAAAADDYDQEAELQAILKMQRAVATARARAALRR